MYLLDNIAWDVGVREAFVEWCGNRNFDHEVVNHFYRVGAAVKRTELSDDEFVDDWGCHFKQGNIFHLIEQQFPEPWVGNYQFPNFSESWRIEGLTEAVEQNRDFFVVAAYYSGLFERGWILRGMENWLIDLVEHEPFVNELLDGICHVLMTFVDVMGRQEGVDAIMLGDDYGQQMGLIMGPTIWRKYFKPQLARLFKRIHEHGKLV